MIKTRSIMDNGLSFLGKLSGGVQLPDSPVELTRGQTRMSDSGNVAPEKGMLQAIIHYDFQIDKE